MPREFRRMEAVHAKEIQRVRQALSGDVPVIVLGDFNGLSMFAAPRAMTDGGYVDSFAAVTEEPDTHPTWHWPLGKINLAFRLDYIFCQRSILVKGSRVIATTASDHNLVVSALEIPVAQSPQENARGAAGKSDEMGDTAVCQPAGYACRRAD